MPSALTVAAAVPTATRVAFAPLTQNRSVLFFPLAVLGAFAWLFGIVLLAASVLAPFMYRRNMLGMEDVFLERLGFLPGIGSGVIWLESLVAGVVTFAFGAALTYVGMSVTPTVG